ncbi:MAG: hypothetical protein R3B09_06995 [Nannocystaceae bacterium]
MTTILNLAASAAAFLLAAKAHGRELRLEREAAGVMKVVFGGSNPPFVEALWAAERLRFWPLALGLAIVAVIALAVGGWPRGALAQAALLWAPTVAFVITGLASFVRNGGLDRGGAIGSVFWWAMAAGALALALRLGLAR